ncbi:hypothetical protein SARC_14799, partial [Sphaeroforma arctica JP610]
EHGPKVGNISLRYPLAYTYFTRLGESKACGDYNSSFGGTPEYPLKYDNIMDSVKGAYVLANNGWIWGGDALHDFAAPGSH